jgi:hypothetical protein
MGAVVQVLSPQLTAAWVIFAVWCGVQLEWYRRVRVAAPPSPTRRTDSARRVPVAKPTVSALPIGGSPEFLAALGLDDSAPQSAAADRSVYR